MSLILSNPREFGASNGNPNNAAAVAQARNVDQQRPILLDALDANANVSESAYGPGYRNALGLQLLLGSRAAPSTRKTPVLWVEKVSSTSTEPGAVWDNGAIYASLEKVGGDAYGAAVTGYAYHNGGTNDVIGVHGRAIIGAASPGLGARGWGVWGYTINRNPQPAPWHAAEFNGVNEGAAPIYGGDQQLIRLCMADGSQEGNRMSSALAIGATTSANNNNNGFLTGIHVQRDSIVQTSGDLTNGEAVLIDGPLDTRGATIGGIRFREGRFKYGLNLREATLANSSAVLMSFAQRLQWGAPASNTFLSASRENVLEAGTIINITPPTAATTRAIRVAGVDVVGTQKPAIPNATTDVANLRDVLNAVVATLRGHGLIAS